MTIIGWIASQETTIKLGIGLIAGVGFYAILRSIIYLANKDLSKSKKTKNWKENLKTMAGV